MTKSLHHGGRAWHVGAPVILEVETTGDTDLGYDITMPAGAAGVITSINHYARQGWAIEISIDVPPVRVDGHDNQAIVNVFDERDLKAAAAESFEVFFKSPSPEVARSRQQEVWIVECEHFYVPGRRVRVCASRAAARTIALGLLEVVVADWNRLMNEERLHVETPTPETFHEVHAALLQAMEAYPDADYEDEFYLDITRYEVEDGAPTAQPEVAT